MVWVMGKELIWKVRNGEIITKILQSGIDEEIAIKSINSILSLRTTEEMFTTLDLAMVDLRDASARF